MTPKIQSEFQNVPYHIRELLADQGHDERRLPNLGCWLTKRQVELEGTLEEGSSEDLINPHK